MTKNSRVKIVADMTIFLCSAVMCGVMYVSSQTSQWPTWFFAVLIVCAVLALADGIYQLWKYKAQKDEQRIQEQDRLKKQGIERLILLDEENNPIKSWDMAGRTSMVIGRAGGEDDVDVNLEDCAFSGFIDFQHAALNFSMEQWYVEDFGSQNGVKIQKAEDGQCYKILGRPCRIQAGDILYIANTKLLLS